VEKRIIEYTIVVISIIIGVTGFTTSDVFAIECSKSSNSSFEMILRCTDTIDVRKSTMEYMYNDINKFSSSFEDTTIYNVKTEGSDTFATLKIHLPVVSALQSDVKFSKSTYYLLEFLNGKLGGSKLYINLNEINGYDGTKNGGTAINFTFQIKDVPCFLMGLKCGSASDFKYALDRGLFLMEPEAREIQLKLDQESNYQNKQKDTQKSTPTNNQQIKQKIKTLTEKITLQISPSVDTDKDKVEDSVIVGVRKRF